MHVEDPSEYDYIVGRILDIGLWSPPSYGRPDNYLEQLFCQVRARIVYMCGLDSELGIMLETRLILACSYHVQHMAWGNKGAR